MFKLVYDLSISGSELQPLHRGGGAPNSWGVMPWTHPDKLTVTMDQVHVAYRESLSVKGGLVDWLICSA